jgi:DNA segregation ATPase FtsK/SpoIIIE, S-DNA-T family
MRRELSGVALLFAAIFVAGSLLAGGHAAGVHCWTATGAFGPIGSCARSAILDLTGPVAAAIVPALVALYAAYLLRAIDRVTEITWRLIFAGFMLLTSVAGALARGAIPWAPSPHPRVDLLGGLPAWVLVHSIGTTGTWILLGLGFCALVAATIARNQILMLLRSARQLAANDDEAGSDPAGADAVADSKWRPVSRAFVPERGAEFRARRGRARRPTFPPELPAYDLLTASSQLAGPDAGQLDVLGYRLTGALRSLKLDGTLIGRTSGPVVTSFEVNPAPGVKLREVANAGPELAAAMKVHSARVVAPIPGRGTVGVEVPNPAAEAVGFRAMAETPEFVGAGQVLPLLLGRDLAGKAVIADLAKMPHLLIAGGGGSGKSMCLNTFVASLVLRHTPATLRFLMIEQGQNDLAGWERLPHQRHDIVRDTQDAVAVIEWAALEMEQRCRTFIAAGARNIRDYNERTPEKAEPYIVLVVNEIADLMLSDEGIEGPLAMLAQRGRAAGIHLILATAKPNATVVTALLKANFPSRIAFRVSSAMDSRRVLDGVGAELLVGKGDMLFVAPGKSEPARLQGTFLAGEEIARLAAWYAQKEGRPQSPDTPSEQDVIDEVRSLEVLPATN